MLNAAPEPLSERQAEIAAMVARGNSNREIASTLGLSPRTVEAHVVAIFNKLGVRSRLELTVALLHPAGESPSLHLNRNNLPQKSTSFIGRENEIAAIRSILETHRLVTLVGSAGVGKTSLSLQVATTMLANFGNGVWLVELAPLTDGDYIPAAIARAVGLTLTGENPLSSLVKQLRTRCALLVFDNCEHIVESAAVAVATILRECQKIKILASSRQHLRVAGEASYRIPPLSVPNDPTVTRLSAADLQRYEATRMFIERASAANDRFSIVDDDAAAITEICRRLDGIPLAIELASARIATLTVRQLHERLDDRFRILTGSGRTSIGRHRTLRALIDWSHDLLDEKERTLFRRLGTFVHGFTLDGAVAVAAGEVDESGVFDALASLVDKSLVLAEAAGDALRYRLLESTRLYACEKLAIAGEQKLAASRHLRFLRDRFAALRAEAERTGRRVEINRAFSSELDNVRSVLDTASESSELLVAAELLAHMRDNWRFLDLRHEGMKRTERMLELLPDSESQLIALLAGSLSRLLYENGNNVRAFDVTNHALAHARASGDIETIALILCYHSYAAIADRKLDVAEVSLAEAEAYTGTSVGLDLRLLRGRATLQYVRGEIDSAIRTGEMLLRKCRSVGETDGGRQAALNLARYEFARGRTQRAREIATVNLVACRVDSDWILPHTLLILAVCLAYEGDLAGAAASAGEATRLWADVEPDEPTTAAAILVRAFIFALRSHFVQAAMLAGYAASVFARYGSTLDAYEAMVQSRLTGILRAGLPIELERLLAEGASLAPDAAIALALGEA